ncbi:hypothetical protein ACK9YZ_01235 [Rhizobium sp. ZK1]|uniref:hypothetical protein n=1 Tax=Rhizobium sp. ZK1 TaxID=3389872 RepID=UPI0039F69EBB
MNALVVPSEHELIASIETARALFNAGDLDLALKIASVTYDQSKSVAGSAERVKASREVVDKARRMQAEALKIESLCYVAMADAVDSAQAKGEISRGGRPKTVSQENGFTLEEIGIDRRQLHSARQLRNAVRADPELIDRVVEARLAEGLEPTRTALKKEAGHAIGTKTATKEERGDDLYETPIEAMRTLLALESFSLAVWEPSVGRGAIMRPLEAAGYDVLISDLVDRGVVTEHGECQGVGDFLKSSGPSQLYAVGPDIVTNPPYGVANAYAAHALREHRPGKMALLLNLNFLAGFEDADRCFVMDRNPPSRVYVFTRRLPMMHRDGWTGNKASSQMNTAWFVWERNRDGSYGDGFPALVRVDWEQYQDVDPLAPGEGVHAEPLAFSDQEDFTRETPRKTLDERIEEEFSRSLIWMKHMEPFDDIALRRGVGLRPSVASALIDAFAVKGLIERQEDGRFLPTGAGLNMIATVGAVEMTRQLKAGVPLEEVLA